MHAYRYESPEGPSEKPKPQHVPPEIPIQDPKPEVIPPIIEPPITQPHNPPQETQTYSSKIIDNYCREIIVDISILIGLR